MPWPYKEEDSLDDPSLRSWSKRRHDEKEKLRQEQLDRWRDNPGSIIDSDGTVWDTGAEHY